MKSVKVIIEGNKEFEIKVDEKDLDTLRKLSGYLKLKVVVKSTHDQND